jgi:opacity protein-like surface antigen
MKKTMVLAVLVLSAMTGFAQESRQDVSVSASDLITPNVHGNTPVQSVTSNTIGLLASYRFMLTPRSALEANYTFAQNTNYFQANGIPTFVPIHTMQQEFSAAYVYSLNYRRYSPFAELGPGAMFFSPIKDYGTGNLDAKRNVNIGALFGAGLAYEVSPSFDIRAEYRGFFIKAPTFGQYTTNRYTVIMTPSLGVAYHF